MPLCEAEGEEGVPVPFRYDISPLESCRTHVFRPNTLSNVGEAKTASIGAIYSGKWDHLPGSKVADVVWEAGLFFFVWQAFDTNQFAFDFATRSIWGLGRLWFNITAYY